MTPLIKHQTLPKIRVSDARNKQENHVVYELSKLNWFFYEVVVKEMTTLKLKKEEHHLVYKLKAIKRFNI